MNQPDVVREGESQVSVESFSAFLEAEKRAHLTSADNIDRLLGRRPRRVKCPHCMYEFDPKNSQYQTRRDGT